jgi:hypothetical protein
VKVVVGGGGTSSAVKVTEWPLPSSSVHVLSAAIHCWPWVLVGTKFEGLSDGDGRGWGGVIVVVVVLLGNVYNDGGGTTTAALG